MIYFRLMPYASMIPACKATVITAKIIFPALCRRVALVRTAGLHEPPNIVPSR